MHIAWLGKKTPFCGNVTYSREITNELQNRNNRVSFIHFAEAQARSDRAFASPEVVLPFLYKSQVYTIPAPKSSKILARSLQDLKPDIVHASLTLSTLDFRLPEICADLDIPLIATFHPPFNDRCHNFVSRTQHLTYQLYAPFLAHYDCTIVFSERQREELIHLGVPPARVAVIPNGVDETKYTSDSDSLPSIVADRPLKQKFEAKRLFVYQGRISTEKNVEALLKAWKREKMGPECKLIIVGDGPLRSQLMPYYGAEDGAIWLGFVAEEAKRIGILQAADVFVLPSLVEGLSLSLLEAMACQVACIATNAGADGEVLKGAGIVLDTQGVTTQLRPILRTFRDCPESILRTYGQAARQRVVDCYTLSKNVTSLETLYQNILDKRRHRPQHNHLTAISSLLSKNIAAKSQSF
ncbi:MAG: glycosyltransferase family 4 protein [Jaaginema sp. PMC 1079.18]|nr:glycosyltransferase family 4 protein [Jaaginema sp. PMC 1080.18]MEC4852110.1 glycosyltransferase family 4 protein [Jaaginema sp. PMC 1079.18]MEC4868745.1 glycosyltransferase family 4 protein [Jaaginema sp. PMC 1078.18]